MSRSASGIVRLAVLLVLASFGGVAPVPAVDPPPAPPVAARNQYALLVGCTAYQSLPPEKALWGPANDVPNFAALLHSSFGFPEKNITRLLGWPDDPAKRATHDNILSAFKELVRKTNKDDQVVILLSGHGMMIPILDPTPAQKWKAHRLAFLPLDVRDWQNDSITNAIYDDDLNGYLEQLRAKGASVLIVFDCCHAGSMSRGVGDERVRSVKPQDLGVPDDAIEKAVHRAKEEFAKDAPAAERSRGGPELLPGGLALSAHDKTDAGSVTAIYACQPFEETMELPRPDDAPRTPDHYFGLLSYTLCQILTEQGHKLTYRELGEILTARYKAERGSRGPTPIVDGDLDREVLGVAKWPGRSSIFIKRDGDHLMLSAGGLMGLTAGSVLSAHPPAGDARGPDAVLGYVRVTRTAPAEADIEPCAFRDAKAVDAKDLPTGAVCRLEQRDFGDLRVKIALAKPRKIEKPDGENAAYNRRLENAAAALKGLDADVNDLLAVVPDDSTAEWVLDVEGEKAVLRQGTGGAVSEAARKEIEANDKTLRALGQPTPRRVFGGYDAAKVEEIKDGLEKDLPRIFSWQTVWRVAGNLDKAGDSDLEFRIVQMNKDKQPGGDLPDGSLVHSGQRMELRLANNTTDDLWVSLLLLDADFGIDVVPMALKRADARSIKATIDGTTFGREGVIVLAFPQTTNRNEPSFRFLKQDPLKEVGDGLVKRRGGGPQTPFGELMETAALGKGTRGLVLDAPTNPLVRSWSWTTAPAEQPKQP